MLKREDFTRCPICKQLFHDSESLGDAITGNKCPRGCEKTYEQPPYESPLVSE